MFRWFSRWQVQRRARLLARTSVPFRPVLEALESRDLPSAGGLRECLGRVAAPVAVKDPGFDVTLQATPDDPRYTNGSLWGMNKIQAPAAWERLLVDAAVIGGRERWARRLKGLEAEFRLRLDQLEAEGDPRRLHLERDLQRLGHLQRFALPVIDLLACWPRQATWKDWLGLLADLASRALRAPDSVLAVLADLQPMEEVGPVGLDEVRGVLEERLSFLQREPEGRRRELLFPR